MEDLQVRWRRFDRADAGPALYALGSGNKNSHFDGRDMRHIDVMINRFVVIEGNLSAFAPSSLLGWRLFRFAVAVRRAAAFRTAKHKILFAGDAPTPNKGSEKEQGKKRVGESSTHPFKV